MKIDRDRIVAAWPLDKYLLQIHGRELTKAGREMVTRCLFHGPDNHPSLTVDVEKGAWHCFPCQRGGGVIDMHAQTKNIPVGQAMNELAEMAGLKDQDQPDTTKPAGTFKRVDTYDYVDEHGQARYHVERLEDGAGRKKFAQYRMIDGQRVNSLEGVTRLLYCLPDVMAVDEVVVVEGEKCVKALVKLGYVATTCCGGSGAWLDAYAESLRDKDVIIMPDSDEPGQKWLGKVHESLKGKARTVAIVHMPEGTNDVADLIRDEGEQAYHRVEELIGRSAKVARGIDIPVYSADELVTQYMQQRRKGVSLRRWLPSFATVRDLIPGDVMTVLAGTGTGKSAILQNIGIALQDHTVLFFELELSGTFMAERLSATATGISCDEIERRAFRGTRPDTAGWGNVWICPQSKIDTTEMAKLIDASELKIGKRPEVVLIDYIGLLSGGAGKRYERLSTIAEDLKVLAKSANVILIVASQIRRKSEDDGDEVGIFDGKDTGSIECSSQLIIGAWRPEPQTMMLRILKDTKGQAGAYITCDFDGPTLRIRERTGYGTTKGGQ